MNVILIVIDALRPDHLSFNGYNRKTCPNIDRIAGDGVFFPNTYTALPRSDPTITSMMTGMYPHSHGVRLVANNKVKPSITTLAEILKSHGYRTALTKPGSIIPEGYDRGFEDFDLFSWKVKNKLKRGIYKVLHKGNFMSDAEQRFSVAKEWIGNNLGKNFFMTIITNDLHWPYPIPKPFDHIFDPDYKGKHTFSDRDGGTVSRGDLIFGVKSLPKEEIDHAIAHYDGGIRYTDQHLGNLLEFLKDKSIYDDTLIIITSDHGEHFGEHGYYFQHGSSLYQPSLNSTLIMSCPKKLPKNKKVKGKVQVIDIMPTVLDILGIPLVDDVEGHSLLPLIEGKVDQVRDFVFAEGIEDHFKQDKRMFVSGVKGKWRAMIVDDWKIIYIPHPKNDIFELYNLAEDPKEEHNLMDKEKEKAEEMKKKILEFLKGQSNEGDVKVEDLTEKSKKLLIKAGYLEG